MTATVDVLARSLRRPAAKSPSGCKPCLRARLIGLGARGRIVVFYILSGPRCTDAPSCSLHLPVILDLVLFLSIIDCGIA